MPKLTYLELYNSNPTYIISNYNFEIFRNYKLSFKNGPTIMKFKKNENDTIKNITINDKYSSMQLKGNVMFSYINNNFNSSDKKLVDDYNNYRDIVISTTDSTKF